ncbi:hypothetical protein HV213_01545 [Klebsiella sp. RHBSTW-00484]|uniref:hypothetical protein n=1 Tax=unclassified Klebsiella TaxID=2608929 RepID=UPI0015E58253|nr:MULTISPECIES: hypothetical protein [unclassified Klebsiella]MBA7844691.1 hypothetical protein [Klebsiella sp. RHBSTW-00465]QLO34615.1 hypothetical protein HV213_01545 [Klebsiella sp. RHBSTW-00484]QLT74129.1 hypothetical protein HV204_01545 [Klebsiella sp. RHBSTW-00464]
MNNGFKRENLRQILSTIAPNEIIDERKYLHGLIRSKPVVLYFADKEIIMLTLSFLYDYKDDYQTIPYVDIREIKMRNVLWRKFALIYTHPIVPIEVEVPGKCLGCPWQSENLGYLLENDFFQNSWPR